MNYAKELNPNNTPQTEPQFGKNQVENNAGGYVFAVDVWTRLQRFLILGAEGGSYYVGERKLVLENAKAVIEAIKTDGVRTVREIVAVSKAGRAPKNDPAIFALALATAHGDANTKAAAYNAIKDVCRTGTHLFQFVDAIQTPLRGWSRGLRRGVAAFYKNRTAEQVAFQAVKYRQREGFTHRDVLRLAHPSGVTPAVASVLEYIVKRDRPNKKVATEAEAQVVETLTYPQIPVIVGYEKAKTAASVAEVVKLITDNELPWEAVPTQFHKEKAVWEALLPNMGLTAMIRNLGRMSGLGMFDNGALSTSTQLVVKTLRDEKAIKESKVHPIQILIGLKTYAQGHGFRGDSTWSVNRQIVDALGKAFYLAFANVQSTGKRFFLGVDVSGSMGSATINNSNLTAREAAAAMALVIAKTEPFYAIAGFAGNNSLGRFGSDQTKLVPLPITPDMSLDQAIATTAGIPFGATDCSLPIEHALASKIMVDVFVIITDNETYQGVRHADVALRDYRKKVNPNAKMVVLATTSSGFTIADPNDAGMLDIAGFDASVPQILADFVR